MPLYNYRCKNGHEFEAFKTIAERANASCSECGELAEQTLSRRPLAVHGFKFGFFEHISLDGAYARNRRELRQLCRENECWAPGILD